MRRYRGAHVYPVVVLSDVFMSTRFGGRRRPNFIIKRWIAFGERSAGIAGRSSESAAANHGGRRPRHVRGQHFDGVDTAEDDEVEPKSEPKTVSEPSLSEELNDSIPI